MKAPENRKWRRALAAISRKRLSQWQRATRLMSLVGIPAVRHQRKVLEIWAFDYAKGL